MQPIKNLGPPYTLQETSPRLVQEITNQTKQLDKGPQSTPKKIPNELFGVLFNYLARREQQLIEKVFPELITSRVYQYAKVSFCPNKTASFRVNLHLKGNGSIVKDKILHMISSSVTHLILTSGFLSSKRIKELAGVFPNLEKLAITSGCKITDEEMKAIAGFTRLCGLEIDANKHITGKNFHYLPSSIQYLSCVDCSIRDASLKYLRNLVHLEKLDLRANRFITGFHFEYLPQSIKLLICSACRLTDDAIERLAHLTALEELIINWNESVTETTLSSIPASVKRYDFSHCPLTAEARRYVKSREWDWL